VSGSQISPLPESLVKTVIITQDTTITSDSVTLFMTSLMNGQNEDSQEGEEAGNKEGAVYIRQKEFIDWVRKRSNEFQNMSDQMISEVYQWEKTMELDNREVEFALRRSLLYSGFRLLSSLR